MLVVRFDSHEGEEHTTHHSRQGYDHLCNLSESQVNHPQPNQRLAAKTWNHFDPRGPRCNNQALVFFILWEKVKMDPPLPKCCGLLILAQSPTHK
jgi:hypothetical protein